MESGLTNELRESILIVQTGLLKKSGGNSYAQYISENSRKSLSNECSP